MDRTPESRVARRPIIIVISVIIIVIVIVVITTVVVTADDAFPRHLSWHAGFWIKCCIREEPPGYY